jgi:hypothetical protein
MSRPSPIQSSHEGQPTLSQPVAEKPVARSKLEVAIKPTRYVPGTGPPLRPITLLPRADTTAYIRGEFIVPRASSGDGKVHVVYLVGWTDLPSARLTVDAADIFDYVSEREYEKWCFERSEERDELERKLEEEENIRAVELAILAEQKEEQRQRQDGTALRNGAFRLTGSESSMSRESSPPALQKKQKTTLGRLKASAGRAPSLLQQESVASEQSAGETEDETSDNDEDAPNRQLREEQDEIVMETEFLQPPAKKRRTASPQPPPPKPPQKSQRSSPVRKPPISKPSTRDLPPTLPRRESVVPIPVVPPQRPRLLATKTPTVAGPSRFPGSLSDVSTTSSSRSTSFPTPPAKGKAKVNGTGGFQRIAITPQQMQKDAELQAEAAMHPPTAKKAKKPKTPKPPKPDPSEIVRFEANQDWEVKRLLDTKFVMEGGKSVRRFLVLWKGDWPPDQNPTWEPEDNIPKKMARKFLAQSAKMGMDGASDTPPPHRPWRPERTFSSVSEAFAGDAEEDPDTDDAVDTFEGHGWSAQKYDSPDDGEDDEMLLVTDDPTPQRTTFTPSNLDWEMAMGRRFGESLAG